MGIFMPEDWEDKIDGHFMDIQDDKDAKRQSAEKDQIDRMDFNSSVQDITNSVIKPTLEKIGKKLEQYHYDFEITYTDYDPSITKMKRHLIGIILTSGTKNNKRDVVRLDFYHNNDGGLIFYKTHDSDKQSIVFDQYREINEDEFLSSTVNLIIPYLA